MAEAQQPATQTKGPAGPPALTALSKRQQLENTNKAIFLWVAAAAFVCTLSIVALQFIIRQGIFNIKIISAQQKTVDTLENNIQNAEGLKQNVNALLANQSLAKLRAAEGDTPFQVIIDALPTSGDTTSFSNSLYSKVLSRSGVSITSTTAGDMALAGAAAAPVEVDPAASSTDGAQTLPYNATISGNPVQVKNALLDIERVIRPIDVNQLNITASEGGLTVNITGKTYFLPRSSVKLGEEKLKP